MTPGRLQELATLDPGDMPEDARVTVTAADLRDFVALLPVAHAAMLYAAGWPRGYILDALRTVGLAR